jgi:drug/metabolite transporter (DMT)-like permease
MGNGARLWPAALAAIAGSVMVGFMPILARHLYAGGVDAPSMLLWRYAIALPALLLAAAATRLDWVAAWRGGAWRIVLVGMTLGAGQTLCFWESIKTLDTSIAVLLFYTYPALTMMLDRILFRRPVRPASLTCVAVILTGAALITLPGLKGGTIDPRGLAWAIPSPLIYVLYLAANSVLLRRHPPLTGAISLYLGLLLTFGAACLVRGLDMPREPDTWLVLLFIALGPGALTITLFSYSVPRLGPSSYAIIANLELVTVVAVGVTRLGEKVTPAAPAAAC